MKVVVLIPTFDTVGVVVKAWSQLFYMMQQQHTTTRKAQLGREGGIKLIIGLHYTCEWIILNE